MTVLSSITLPFGLSYWQAAGLLLVGWVVYRFYLFYLTLQSVRFHPGARRLFSTASLLGNILPSIPYVAQGANYHWRVKRGKYDAYDRSILAQISVDRPGRPSFTCSNPASVKVLNGDRRRFRKPVESYKILNVYGKNLVSTEGEEWRRHRKVVAPGFSEKVFELVWQVTTQIFFEMVEDEGWGKLKAGESARVQEVPELILRLALGVLATASFGAPLQWKVDPATNLSAGHSMSFADAISGVSEHIIFLLLLPKILFKLPIKKIRKAAEYDRELRSYMYGMIRERKEEVQRGEVSPRHDLFNQLISASLNESSSQGKEGGGGGGGMSDEELVGNTFIFALAGHETSAHTLSFSLAYLAVNPLVQDWLREEVDEVLKDGEEPTYATHFAALPRTLAVFYETLRLHPAVQVIPKKANEDTFLEDDPDPRTGEKRMVFIPAEANVDIDVVSLHRHPDTWKDPESFNPQRFLESYDKDAFVPFSAGARGCIGRRFAEVEGVCILALLVKYFSISPAPLLSGQTETPEETKARLLAIKRGITLTPVDVSLTFTRRGGSGLTRPAYHDQ